MSELNSRPLGDLIQIRKGKKPASVSPRKQNEAQRPYLLIDSFGGEYKTFTDDASCPYAKPNETLLVWDGERCGLTSIGHEGYIGSTLAAIQSTTEDLQPNYLFHFLVGKQKEIRNSAEGTGVPHVSRRFLEDLEIKLPPLPEQKKIAEILSGIDRKHSKLKGRINALSMIRIQLVREFLKQGMRKETDHANGLPQGWEERTLGEVSEFRRGSFPQPYGNPEWFDDAGYPFVQVYDIDDNGKLKPNTKNKISQAAADKSVFIPSGSLIVSLQGSIGRVAITQYDSYVDRTILIFTDYERILSREYFSLLVGDLFSRKGEVADGGVIKTITKQTLKEFSIRIPPLDEQQKLSEVVRAIDHSISLYKEQLFKVDLLRQSLACDLLSGRKRVTL